jgi:hypothetical protein
MDNNAKKYMSLRPLLCTLPMLEKLFRTKTKLRQ